MVALRSVCSNVRIRGTRLSGDTAGCDQPATALGTEVGLTALAASLYPGAILGLWSNDPPDEAFSSLLHGVFASAEFRLVTLPNPYTGGESSNTIYLAYRAG
tara:strand:- start:143 stop:448 length:306 start_codon:yes stop_codon:yes gene_type:complete